jgi:hypothetical protein
MLEKCETEMRGSIVQHVLKEAGLADLPVSAVKSIWPTWPLLEYVTIYQTRVPGFQPMFATAFKLSVVSIEY